MPQYIGRTRIFLLYVNLKIHEDWRFWTLPSFKVHTCLDGKLLHIAWLTDAATFRCGSVSNRLRLY
jgi:hypothetical protein